MQACARAAPKYGLPIAPKVIDAANFTMGYCPARKISLWTYEILGRIPDSIRRRHFNLSFVEEFRVPEHHRAKKTDFQGSDYNKGHLAASGNYPLSADDKAKTYVLSNIAPQNPKLNHTLWHDLERWSRDLTKLFREVHIITGPLFAPKNVKNGHRVVTYRVIGESNVAVPTHFYKVILGEPHNGSAPFVAGFSMPNKVPARGKTFKHYQVPVQQIEEISGLVFFEKLDPAVAGRLKGQIHNLEQKGV